MWKRLDVNTPGNKDPDCPDDEEFGDPDLGRTYGKNGKPWPRLAVFVTDWSVPSYSCTYRDGKLLSREKHVGPKEFSVNCSGKQKPGMEWRECNIPLELLPELVGLLRELKERKR